MMNQDINKIPSMAEDAKARADANSRMLVADLRPPVVKGEGSANWTHEDVAMAVRDIYDMSEKTQINFLMLGELGRAIRDKTEQFNTDHLEIGMFARGLTPEVRSLFKTWGFAETKYGYIYYFTPPIRWSIKIPVEIHVIKKNYKFFDNPDRGWFGVDDFYIPNPFEKYWKARFLI